MLAKLTARDYMTKNPFVLKPDTDVFEAIRQFIERKITGVPVVDESGQLVGLFSELDCMKAVATASYFEEMPGKIGDLMTTEFQRVPPTISIVELAELFSQATLRQCPVVDEGKLVGVISRVDVLRALVKNW
jgi:CBS domain-containing protein